jgi:hypothetical protein
MQDRRRAGSLEGGKDLALLVLERVEVRLVVERAD